MVLDWEPCLVELEALLAHHTWHVEHHPYSTYFEWSSLRSSSAYLMITKFIDLGDLTSKLYHIHNSKRRRKYCFVFNMIFHWLSEQCFELQVFRCFCNIWAQMPVDGRLSGFHFAYQRNNHHYFEIWIKISMSYETWIPHGMIHWCRALVQWTYWHRLFSNLWFYQVQIF